MNSSTLSEPELSRSSFLNLRGEILIFGQVEIKTKEYEAYRIQFDQTYIVTANGVHITLLHCLVTRAGLANPLEHCLTSSQAS